MALHFNDPLNPAGYTINYTHEALFILKERLVDVGWTVIQSGTGNSGSYAAGDLISTAADLNNPRAWFAIKEPNGDRVFVIQRGTTGAGNFTNLYRIKYVRAGGVGTGNANTTPTATVPSNEVVILGAGTDASPSFDTWTSMSTSSTTPDVSSLIIFTDDSGEHSFGLHIVKNSDKTSRGTFLYTEMEQDPHTQSDPDPVAVVAMNANSYSSWAWYATAGMWRGLLGSTMTILVAPYTITSGSTNNSVVPAADGYGYVEPNSGYDLLFSFPLLRDGAQTAPTGYKGRPKYIKATSTRRAVFSLYDDHTSGSTIPGAWISVVGGYYVFPWNNETPLI